jgi:hypothetical protein
VRSIALLKPGTSVEATIEHGGRTVAIKARVVWASEPQYQIGAFGEMGLALEEVPEEYTSLLAELFAE